MAKSWQMVVAKGEFPHRKGGVVQVIDDAAVQAMANAFDPERKLLVDFDHYSDLTPDQLAVVQAAGVQLPSEAAGWITALEPRADGLWAQIDLTPEGAAALKDGSYRFVSPVFPRASCEAAGEGRVRPLALGKAGLTNEPNITAIPALENRTDETAQLVGSAVLLNRADVDFCATGDNPNKSEKRTMDYKAKLIALLGLPADADDAAISAALEGMANAKKDAEAAKADAAAMKNRAEAAEAKVIDFEKAALKAKVDAALKEHEGVIANRADMEAALTKDFDGTLKTLKALKTSTLPNRTDGEPPVDGGKPKNLTGIARVTAAFAKK